MTKFIKAGREHPLGLNVPLRLAQLGLALHIWCLELPCSSSGSRLHTGQESSSGAAQCCLHSTGAAAPPARLVRMALSMGAWRAAVWSLTHPPSDKLRWASRLFTTVKLYGYELRGRWIKSNYISEQEGSKKLVRSGVEERIINDSIFA